MSLVRLNIKSRIELETRVLAAALKQSFEHGDSAGASLAHKQLFTLLKDVNNAQPGNIDCIRVADGAPPGLTEAEEAPARVAAKPVTVPKSEEDAPAASIAAKLYSQPLFGAYNPSPDTITAPTESARADGPAPKQSFMRNSARLQLNKQPSAGQDEIAEIVGFVVPEGRSASTADSADSDSIGELRAEENSLDEGLVLDQSEPGGNGEVAQRGGTSALQYKQVGSQNDSRKEPATSDDEGNEQESVAGESADLDDNEVETDDSESAGLEDSEVETVDSESAGLDDNEIESERRNVAALDEIDESENFEVPQDDFDFPDGLVQDNQESGSTEEEITGETPVLSAPNENQRETSGNLPVIRTATSDAISPRTALSTVPSQTRTGENAGGLYEMLEVSQMSAFDEIHRNFLRKARLILREIRNNKAIRYDKLPELQKLWIAHDILTDPVTRTDYDFRDLGVRGTPEVIVHPAEDTLPVRLGARTPLRIGELLQAAGLLESAELEIACDMHKAMPEMQFGTFLVKQGFIEENHLDAVLVGQKLLRAGAISVAQFQSAMEGFGEDDHSLPELLVSKGYITAPNLELTLNPPPPEESSSPTVQIREVPIAARSHEAKTQEMKPAMPSWSNQLDWGPPEEDAGSSEPASTDIAATTPVAPAQAEQSLGELLSNHQKPAPSIDGKHARPSWQDQLDWGSSGDDTAVAGPSESSQNDAILPVSAEAPAAEPVMPKAEAQSDGPKLQLSNAVPTWKDQLDWGSPSDSEEGSVPSSKDLITAENAAIASGEFEIAFDERLVDGLKDLVQANFAPDESTPLDLTEPPPSGSEPRRRADISDILANITPPPPSESQFEIPPAPYNHTASDTNQSLLPSAMLEAFEHEGGLDIPTSSTMKASDIQPSERSDEELIVPEEGGLFAHLLDKTELFESSAMLLGEPRPIEDQSHVRVGHVMPTADEEVVEDVNKALEAEAEPVQEVEQVVAAASSEQIETEAAGASEEDAGDGEKEPESGPAGTGSKKEKRKKTQNKGRKRR